MYITESYVDIKGYEGKYQIGDFGNVKTLPRRIDIGKFSYNKPEKFLKKGFSSNGYYTVALYKDSKSKRFNIHRLVAEHFIPNACNYNEVNHINGKKKDNNVWNLEWCTRSHNHKEAFRLGLRKAWNKGLIWLDDNNYLEKK